MASAATIRSARPLAFRPRLRSGAATSGGAGAEGTTTTTTTARRALRLRAGRRAGEERVDRGRFLGAAAPRRRGMACSPSAVLGSSSAAAEVDLDEGPSFSSPASPAAAPAAVPSFAPEPVRLPPRPSSSSSDGTRPKSKKKKPKPKGEVRIRPSGTDPASSSEGVVVVVDEEEVAGSFPLQGPLSARVLFRRLAPHVELRTLGQLAKEASRALLAEAGRGGKGRKGRERALDRKLDALFRSSGASSKGRRRKSSKFKAKEKAAAEYSWSLRAHPWIRPSLRDYLLGKFLDEPGEGSGGRAKGAGKSTSTSKRGAAEEDPTYPPLRNLIRREAHLETLSKAREASSTRNPVFWTARDRTKAGFHHHGKGRRKGKGRREEYLAERRARTIVEEGGADDEGGGGVGGRRAQEEAEAEEVLDVLASRLPPPHFDKLMEFLEGYAGLDDGAEEEDGDRDGDGDDGEDTDESLREARARFYQTPVLGKVLSDASPTHGHLVAADLARYLRVDDAKEGAAARGNRELRACEERHRAAEDDFAAKMVEVQRAFASPDEGSRGAATGGAGGGEGAVGEVGADDGDDDDASSPDLSAEKSLRDLRLEDEDRLSLEETLEELRKMGLRKGEEEEEEEGMALYETKKKKHVNLRFTVVDMGNEDESPDSDTESHGHADIDQSELEDKIIFINNLPIDTTEEEIDEVYSRFGPLDSIKLFNLRPDLDPGPLSKKKLQELRRSVRMNHKDAFQSLARYQKQRPRSPAYGMLRFQTAEGYNVATLPDLYIYGCVIRRHPVLTIKTRDVKTLHLEQIPPDFHPLDVELKLAQLLQPHDFSIMQNTMADIGSDRSSAGDLDVEGIGSSYSEISSCRIKFEDFRAALRAHQWMAESGDGSGEKGTCDAAKFLGGELQWFETPTNSMEWWTRLRCF
ncbi:hypothetical protein ACHAWF_016053 [Thalassiosira exigua]